MNWLVCSLAFPGTSVLRWNHKNELCYMLSEWGSFGYTASSPLKTMGPPVACLSSLCLYCLLFCYFNPSDVYLTLFPPCLSSWRTDRNCNQKPTYLLLPHLHKWWWGWRNDEAVDIGNCIDNPEWIYPTEVRMLLLDELWWLHCIYIYQNDEWYDDVINDESLSWLSLNLLWSKSFFLPGQFYSFKVYGINSSNNSGERTNKQATVELNSFCFQQPCAFVFICTNIQRCADSRSWRKLRPNTLCPRTGFIV